MSKDIAVYNTSLSMGGISKSLITLLKHPCMKEYRIDLFILSKKNDFGNIDLPKNVNVYLLPPKKAIAKYLPFGLLEKLIGKNTNLKKYDYAVDFNGYHNLCAVYALRTNAAKHIIWVHNDYERRYLYNNKFKILWMIMKQKYRKFNLLVCVSKGAEEAFKRLYKRDIRTEVIPNIVDAETIVEMSTENNAYIPKENTYNLVSVGNLCKAKNIDKQLDIVKQLKNHKNICLYIIGDGKERKRLEKKVKKLSLEDNVYFLGLQKNPYKYMKKMDGLIFTSLYEGQGIVVREAQILGLDLFIDKSLEKYNTGIAVSDNLVKDILHTHKKTKKICYLKAYNTEIEAKVKSLFS